MLILVFIFFFPFWIPPSWFRLISVSEASWCFFSSSRHTTKSYFISLSFGFATTCSIKWIRMPHTCSTHILSLSLLSLSSRRFSHHCGDSNNSNRLKMPYLVSNSPFKRTLFTFIEAIFPLRFRWLFFSESLNSLPFCLFWLSLFFSILVLFPILQLLLKACESTGTLNVAHRMYYINHISLCMEPI